MENAVGPPVFLIILIKGGMVNWTHLVEDGYSPLGSNETLPCPDGTFAFRKKFTRY